LEEEAGVQAKVLEAVLIAVYHPLYNIPLRKEWTIK